MIQRFQIYFETLETLPTEQLDRSAQKLVHAEKRNVALVIAHLAEMSRRKGELECGYKNLFDYGVKRLGLSEGSVARRVQVANVSRRFPQILVALAENRISLTVAGMLAPHLREHNVEKLLSECERKSKREVEEYLVALKPKPVFEPSIRKAPSPRAPETESAPENEALALGETSPGEPSAPPIPSEPPSVKGDHRRGAQQKTSPPVLEPATTDRFNFRFAADRKFKEKLERLAEVLGIENPKKNMDQILEQALDIALEVKDPKRKRAGRPAKESKKSRPGKVSQAPAKSRYIPSEVRERVYERAGHQCQYVAADETRCDCRTGLEIEHERPFAIFRSHDEQHLKVLCKRHNRFMAERVYGFEFIRRKIDERRRSKMSPPVATNVSESGYGGAFGNEAPTARSP